MILNHFLVITFALPFVLVSNQSALV
jgi:hypothetical protein